ncbi:MAG TPA: DUF4307 domain-containing protein [Micromonosporaceae bacterium]|nr:DUF4307 domain-containing protein [Micromonosporaceae bacterium]
MTETPTTIPTAAGQFPPGRYGRRRTPQRRRPWLTAVLVAGVVAAGALVAFRLYGLYGDPAYDAQVVTYTEITDTQIVIDFQVTVPPGGSAECLLRARSRDGAEVGSATVRVAAPPGTEQVVSQHRLATSARPLFGEVLRCRAAD